MLQQFLIIFGFFAIVLLLMLLSLHFSKYKKRPEGCSGGHCSAHDFNSDHHTCTLHNNDEDKIDVKELKV